MKGALTVFRKEFIDGIRERRSVISALFFGPLFGPLMFGFMINFAISQRIDEVDQPITVPVIGAQYAPNVVAALGQAQIDIDTDEFSDRAALRASVAAGDTDVGIVIDSGFGEALAAGDPARIWIVSDRSNNAGSTPTARVRGAIRNYSQTIGSLRLSMRGVDPTITQPIALLDEDVSTPSGRSVLLLSMMTYFLLFASLLGGTQVAIDATAGERERGSLEPLLTMPVARNELVLGKMFATFVFMATSLAISIAAFSIAVQFLPLAKLGMTANLNFVAGLQIYFVMLPFAMLGAAAMMIVASYTKSFKEAQTYTSLAMLAPTLPIIAVALKPVSISLPLMLVPSLAQHLLVTDIVKAEGIEPVAVVVSWLSTLAVAGLLTWLTIRRYGSEKILV